MVILDGASCEGIWTLQGVNCLAFHLNVCIDTLLITKYKCNMCVQVSPEWQQNEEELEH